MADEVFEIEPLIDPKDKNSQRIIIWALVSVFLVMNMFIIIAGTLDPVMGANILNIVDLIFWFDISIAGIVGSYFGIDIVSSFTSKQTITMKKIS